MRKLSALEYLAGVEPTENAQASAPTNLHVITAEVSSKSEDGTARVSMDGLVYSEDESQEIDIDTLGGLEEGDTVTILLAGESGHGMTPLALGSVGSIDRIVTNVSEIQADYVKASELEADVADFGYATVDELEANYATIQSLEATNADVDNLKTTKADITDLEANYATIENLTAANGRISNLETSKANVTDLQAANAEIESLKTAKADITDLEANYATIENLTAANGRISNLETSKADITDLEANYAHISNGVIDNATIGYADVDGLDANYVTTDFLNADVGWIQNGVIKDGSISSAMINDVSANKLTAGTINGSVINVTNLNADNITTGTINGQRIGEGSLSLSKLEEDVYTESEVDAKLSTMQAEIDGAIETWTGTAVPTLNNAPASSWTTAAVRDTHVGDVYFVVNSQSEQNGYNYRFTKSGNSYSWQLIKDSDVTNALQRITAAEGQITTFDSDISQLKTDTGTLTTKTTSLETRMSDAEDDILDKVDVTTFNEVSDTVDGHTRSISQMSQTLSNKADSSTVTSLTNRVSKNEQDISGINTTVGELETTVESKADGSTVETVSNKLNTVSDTVDGHTQAISSVQSTLSTKADSSTVSTLSTKVNTISDTVDGHTQTIGSIQTTQTTMQTTLDKTLVETTQLWYSKANTTAPAKPTSQVTSTSTAGNAWRTVVPAYNASYPNYYYCYQWKYSDGTYGWSSVTRDIAMGESQATARTAASDASTAKTDASAAVTTANTASTNASTALSTAQTADSNASTALSTAQTADSNASAAVTTANTAASDATTAKNTANTAKSTADTAKATADKNVKESIQLWFTKANTTAPSKPTSAVTSNSTAGNAWRIVVPTYSSTYPYYYYCWQYKLADGTYTWSDVVYDRATTENQKNSHDALTQVSTKVETSTFNTVKNTVDSNSATITQLQTITTNNGLTENTNIAQTVNTVKQTADSNSAHITNVVTTLGLAADGSSQSEDIVHKYNELDQTLDGTVSRVGKTEESLKTVSNPNLTPYFSHKKDDVYNATSNNDGYWVQSSADGSPSYITAWDFEQTTSNGDGWAHLKANNTTNVTLCAHSYIHKDALNLKPSTEYTFLVEWLNVTLSGTITIFVTTEHGGTNHINDDFFTSSSGTAIASGSGSKYLTVTTRASLQSGSDKRIRTYVHIPVNASVDGYIRISLYEGKYDGPYKPYVDQSVSSRVSQAETSIEQTSNNVLIKATKNDTTAAQGGQHLIQSLINVAPEGVKIAADKVNIEGAAIFTSGRLSSTSLNNAYDAKGSASAVQQNLDNLQVGGRNLLRGKPVSYSKNAYLVYVIYTTIALNELEVGDTITIQLWGASIDANSTGLAVFWGGGSIPLAKEKKPDSSGYVKIAYTVTEANRTHANASNKYIHIYNFVNGHSGASAYIEKWKLERGTKGTDWSPAPEDVTAYVDSLTIGGRNLLLWTGSLKKGANTTVNGKDGITAWGGALSLLTETDDGIKMAASNHAQECFAIPLATNGSVGNGEKVLLTFEARGNITSVGQFYWIQASGANIAMTSWLNGSSTISLSETNWTKFTVDVSNNNANVRTCTKILLFYGLGSANNGKWVELRKKSVKLEKGDRATDWTPAPEETVFNTQRIYYRKSSTGAPTEPSSWVTNGNNGENYYNQWTTKVPPIASGTGASVDKYAYLYTCEQYQMADGTLDHTTILLDENTTVIDGGNVITGSLKANAVDALSGTFNTANIPALTADHIKASVIDAVNNGTGTINADKINVSGISIGDLDGVSDYATKADVDQYTQPNLSPLTQASLTDVYNATTNPDGYWKSTLNSSWFTQLDDGWIRVYADNSSGTAARNTTSFRPRPCPSVVPGETYTILIEVRNNHSTGSGQTDMCIQQTANNQFWGSGGGNIQPLTLGETAVIHSLKVADSAHLTSTANELFRYNSRCAAGSVLDFELRMSIYPGEYDGPFKPYVSSKVDITNATNAAAKTATNFLTEASSTGLMVHPSNDSTTGVRITSDVDIVRVGKVRNRIDDTGMTLYNSDGIDSTDPDKNVVAKFADKLIELGKNATDAIVRLCGGKLDLTYFYDDDTGIQYGSLYSLTHIRMWSGIDNPSGDAAYGSVSATNSQAHMSGGVSAGYKNGTTLKTSSLSANVAVSESETPNVSALVYTGTTSSGTEASFKLDPSGFSINDTTPIKGIYAGTKVVAPSNGAATLLTASEVQSHLGSGASQTNTVCIATNGDGSIWGGMMTGAMMQDGSAKAFISPATTGSLRFNFVLIRFA